MALIDLSLRHDDVHGYIVPADHMMRYDSDADASNQRWVKHYCQKCPGMQFILDHCARGFNPYEILKGRIKLSHLSHLWVDTKVDFAGRRSL